MIKWKTDVYKDIKNFDEFSFNLTEFKTMGRCRRADVFVGRKNETSI
tara:strand:+ start:1911 stop:2051 length:141 start_codon:yes stop_codon:yes gene_type:complete